MNSAKSPKRWAIDPLVATHTAVEAGDVFEVVIDGDVVDGELLNLERGPKSVDNGESSHEVAEAPKEERRKVRPNNTVVYQSASYGPLPEHRDYGQKHQNRNAHKFAKHGCLLGFAIPIPRPRFFWFFGLLSIGATLRSVKIIRTDLLISRNLE